MIQDFQEGKFSDETNHTLAAGYRAALLDKWLWVVRDSPPAAHIHPTNDDRGSHYDARSCSCPGRRLAAGDPSRLELLLQWEPGEQHGL